VPTSEDSRGRVGLAQRSARGEAISSARGALSTIAPNRSVTACRLLEPYALIVYCKAVAYRAGCAAVDKILPIKWTQDAIVRASGQSALGSRLHALVRLHAREVSNMIMQGKDQSPRRCQGDTACDRASWCLPAKIAEAELVGLRDMRDVSR
jgi:hypothetical protein